MFTSHNRVGRLVELRIGTPLTRDEIDDLVQQQLINIARIPGKYVSVVDLRPSNVFPPAIAEQLIGLMTQGNPKLERSAFLLPESAILGLQAERAVQEGGGDQRRVLRDPRELEAWLGEVLGSAELQRLREFLNEHLLG